LEGKVDLQFENSSPESAFGNQKLVSKSFCKSVTKVSAGINSQIIKCPKGCNGKIWRDGYYTPMFGERIQRWSCCECGYKFSDPSGIERAEKHSNKLQLLNQRR
jgi:C4-type Zn-finger protein